MNISNEITYEESICLANPVYIDVRSPGEYEHDHIPGSVNLPIFDNDERSEIGTLYRASGRDTAIIRGLGIAGGKLEKIINEISMYSGMDIVLLCFRGGMRSASLCSLLNSLGIRVCRLYQGYKGYRRYIANAISSVRVKPPLFVLHGLTGAGKTDIIRKLPNSIDLEGMAGHRSSIFGGIGLKAHSQKKFESLLMQKIILIENERCAVIEGESRKIGDLHIPQTLYKQMLESPGIMIETPIELRADIIVREYTKDINRVEVLEIVKSLGPKLGGKKVEKLIDLFESDALRQFVLLLLELYYDPLYRHTVEKMNCIATIKNISTDDAVGQIKTVMQSYLDNTDAQGIKKEIQSMPR